MSRRLIVLKNYWFSYERHMIFSCVTWNYYIINLVFSFFLAKPKLQKGLLSISKSMIFTENRRHCNGRMFRLISPLRGALRLWLPRNRVHACVCPLGSIHHSDPEPEQAPGEQEKATGTRDRREIYMKIERRIDRCVLHKIDVSRIMRGDIFIPRHVSVRVQRRRPPPPHKSPRVNLYPNKKRKIIPSPSERRRIFAIKKKARS